MTHNICTFHNLQLPPLPQSSHSSLMSLNSPLCKSYLTVYPGAKSEFIRLWLCSPDIKALLCESWPNIPLLLINVKALRFFSHLFKCRRVFIEYREAGIRRGKHIRLARLDHRNSNVKDSIYPNWGRKSLRAHDATLERNTKKCSSVKLTPSAFKASKRRFLHCRSWLLWRTKCAACSIAVSSETQEAEAWCLGGGPDGLLETTPVIWVPHINSSEWKSQNSHFWQQKLLFPAKYESLLLLNPLTPSDCI